MNDDLERQLDEFYRRLDGSARRVEARWKSTPDARSNRIAAWLGAGVAAAAAILLMISALRSDPKPVERPMAREDTPVEPAPRPVVPPPPLPPPPPKPAPVEAPRRTEEPPRLPERRPEPPAPERPRPEPAPVPRPTPQPEPPKRPDPVPATRPVRATALLRETEGSFELADRSIRGKQKEVSVGTGDRLRASTTVKLALADDRFILLSPRTVVEFRPDEKRLSLAVEQGDLLADLLGPGPDLRVITKACEIAPLGTVFAVKVDPGRVLVTVEKGRVEVRSPKGRTNLRAAEALQASEDGTLGAPSPADFRATGWARTHRAPESTPYFEDFSKPGTWFGELDRGVIRAVARPGSGPTIQAAADKPLFEVPVRGSITIVCRADRLGKFKIQLYSPEQKTTYTRQGITIPRGDAWRTVTVDFDELVPSDKTRPQRLPPGAPVTDFLIMYGDEGERGNFWVDAVKITEVRP